MMPSLDVLWRHWLRSCWIIDMWRQADVNRMDVKPVTDYGWKTVDQCLLIETALKMC